MLNNKIYIGYTEDFHMRKYRHLSDLRLNRHDNCHLQSSWNKHGQAYFLFEVLEEVNTQFLASQENYWCNLLNTHNDEYGYNIDPTHPDNKHAVAESTKQKISKANKGRKRPDNTLRMTGKRLSDESIEKMRKTKTGKKVGPCSEERKKRISESNIGKKKTMPVGWLIKIRENAEKKRGVKREMSDKWKSNIAESAKMRTGWKHTEEARRKISDAGRNRKKEVTHG